MLRLVVATRNAKKKCEIAELLEPHGIEVVSLAELPDAPEIVEDGQTFAENAAKKARQTAMHLGTWAVGEDSGLSVDALNGDPGVYSARYSGHDATDAANNAKLIAALQGVPAQRRGGGYVCHVALSDPQGNIRVTVEDTCRGRLIDEPRGDGGFGYDPHFLIPEYHRTFGELSPRVKHQLSHRGRAFRRFIPQLLNALSGD